MPNSLLKIILLTIAISIAGFNHASAAKNTVLDFDGTSDYVVVSDNAVLDQADRLSLSVWIEPDDAPGEGLVEYILYRYNNYYLKIDENRKIIGSVHTDAERITSAAAITCDGAAWTHIEMTYDREADGDTDLKLYINGVLDATANYSTAIAASDRNLYFGAGDTDNNLTPDNWFDGQIDHPQLYQYARSADAVRVDYNEGLATHLGPVLKNCADDPASCMDYGLVGSWNMDEGTGLTAYNSADGTFGVNNGTLTGGPKWTTDSPPLQGGAGGGSLQFDGVDDYVDCGNDPSLNPTDAITIEAWVKPNDMERYMSPISSDWPTHLPAINKQGNNAGLFYLTGVKNWVTHNSIDLYNGNFHHIVWTYDKDDEVMKMYVDGSVEDTEPATGSITSGAGYWWIGSFKGSPSQYYFNGTIDEVRIYNRALSANEVQYHYNKGGPVAEWGFDEGEGTVAYDESSNDNDGTLGDGTCLPGAGTCPSWIEGKYGGALSFDGDNDYVDCGSDESLDITDAITISAWVKAADSPSTNRGIVGKNDGTDSHRYYYGIRTGWSLGYYPTIKVGGFYHYAPSYSMTIGQWTYLTGTYDSETLKYFVDGEFYGQNTIPSGSIDSAPSKSVYMAYPSGDRWKGAIDEVRIYNRALSAEEILREYNAGVATHFR